MHYQLFLEILVLRYIAQVCQTKDHIGKVCKQYQDLYLHNVCTMYIRTYLQRKHTAVHSYPTELYSPECTGIQKLYTMYSDTGILQAVAVHSVQ